MLVVTREAYNKLGAKTKAELLSAVFGTSGPSSAMPSGETGGIEIDWENVVNLTPGDIEEFIDEASSMYDGTVAALKVIAEYGPIVHSSLLKAKLIQSNGEPWFEELAVFQRSTTRRVRSVTGGKHDYLLGWDDWKNGEGHYAVTDVTHRSLRVYFGIE
jgi:hypothetical protein